ncbi:MAG: GNAT family N-acetyltransferase [Beijerinckiaceae bacterium]|nr:GNAT family N-acetyltransferase [Beijerinckiaceae bacterium]
MTDHELMIRDAREADAESWRRLWDLYIEFYHAKIPGEVTDSTWRRILDPVSPVFAIVAERGASLLGFAVCVLHEATWTTTPVCYLEDLFVAPEARGAGAGRALITALMNRARAAGWSRVYWHTQEGNTVARNLYDEFARADDFVRYRLSPS